MDTPAPSSPPPVEPELPDVEAPATYPAPPQNVGSPPFSILVALFEKLQVERRQERRKRLIDSWFNHWREEKGYDLYPVLRLMLPQKDRERAVYGLKEKNLAKAYIKLIPLGMKDPDAIRLLNWKKPTDRDRSSGDFPTVLYEVVSKRSSVIEGSLTVDDLNELLDELAKNMGNKDVQSRVLQRVYNRSTPDEQRWIVRVILKDMQISVKETTIFAVFHPDAQDLYNTCSDLKKVAWELWDPSYRLNAADKAVQLFHAFAPMLCKRPTKKIEDTVKQMQGSNFFIEEKLDGERMQLHRRGNEYFYCSRKGKDYTYLYGKHIGAGSLTPFIDDAFDSRIDDIILDGEMLVWDPVSERNLPFGTLKTAALDRSKKEHNPRPCFKVFDLLHLNGQSLIHRSTEFRKKNLRACLSEIPGRIEFTAEYRGTTAGDIRSRMDEIMANRGEGLVIKHPASKYVLNGRNMDWIKVKPEYMDNLGETVDVLVVAGNYGSGKRGGGVSTLICAVLDDRIIGETENDLDEAKYSSFVRIGTGLSFADYVWIRSKPWKPWDPKNPPEFLQISKRGTEDKGDVYLEPEDSFLVKVKAAEVVPSDLYHLGFTMRFPRAIQIRDDLTVADCACANDVLVSMRTERKRKMEQDAGVTKKKRKTVAKKPAILPEYKGPKLKDVNVDSDLFQGLTFVVMSDPKSRTGNQDRKDLMKIIHTHGGKCAQIAGSQPNLFVVYGGTVTPYDLKLLIDKGFYDVINPAWVEDSIALGQLAPLKKSYFFYASETRKGAEEYTHEDDVQPSRDVTPIATTPHEVTPKVEEDDTPFSNWLRVDEEDRKPVIHADESDSATDPDSGDDDGGEADDLDDWLEVHNTGDGTASSSQTLETLSGASNEVPEITMGEDDNAMEYDQDKIFKHLCFYLDSPENAEKHGMPVKGKYKAEISASFQDIANYIISNGGRIGDFDETKLTHVILDKRDTSRRVELMKRTSQPKRRHLVISDFIQACLEEETLLDEEAFAP
ncbi:DNA ligase 4 [Pluteus cervinus]|uniref:DNA ligase 4 n=1 Tax=Pluteus cervinus TaxID=181527 RepID=A0ACD3B0S8_9AGAR|nr:DNA ligase 4 [Pluteus cervinus]